MAIKRPPPATPSSLVKRSRVQGSDDAEQDAAAAADAAAHTSSSLIPITSSRDGKDKGLVRSVKRTSGLSDPILSLSGGHTGEILDVKFSLDGEYVAAAGGDKSISIWKTYSPNNHVTSLLSHSKAVICLAFLAPSTTTSNGFPSSTTSLPLLLSGSADSTIILWSPLSSPPHNKLRRFRHHKGIVNCLAPSPTDPTLFASGSDDGEVCIWKTQDKKPWEVLKVGYPVTALEWTKDGSGLFVGGVDNQIHLYDLHRKQILYSLTLHTDTITSLSLSPSGSYLMSFSLDSSLKVWDVRPFAISSSSEDLLGTGSPMSEEERASKERLHKTLSGSLNGADALLIKGGWSRDSRRIILGSGDRTCVVWDVESEKILYKLPGHRGTCTSAAYHPREPIVVSSSTDGQLLLGEIEP